MSEDRGFTLIEVIIVVAIAGVIATLGFNAGSQVIIHELCESKFSTLRSALFYTRGRALAGLNGGESGLHVEPYKLVIFSGPKFDSKDPTNEIFEEAESAIRFEAEADVIFESRSAITSDESIVRLADDNNSCDRSITINNEGAIIW